MNHNHSKRFLFFFIFRRSSVIADIDLNFAENATDVTPEAVNSELPRSGQMGNLTYNPQTAQISG